MERTLAGHLRSNNEDISLHTHTHTHTHTHRLLARDRVLLVKDEGAALVCRADESRNQGSSWNRNPVNETRRTDTVSIHEQERCLPQPVCVGCLTFLPCAARSRAASPRNEKRCPQRTDSREKHACENPPSASRASSRCERSSSL